MSDDFGTVNIRRGEKSREIEVLRGHYRQHRDALQRMTTDAPTEHLASEYQRLIAEIDRALGKLDELEGRPAAPPIAPPGPEPTRPHGDPLAAQRPRSEAAMAGAAGAAAGAAGAAGMRPLAASTAHDSLADAPTIPPVAGEPRSRLPLIIGAALVALALIAWLIWRASDRGDETIVEENPAVATGATSDTAENGTSTADDTIAASAPAIAGLSAAPEAHDYGVIRKGTRATRQYELTNTTDEPMTVNVARSTCRCLFYEHAPVIPPKGKENLTVTIDGARANAGDLREQIRVSSKADAAIGTTIEVTATVR
ncbi:MAG TPA: DUF1573 domain-containing protein [Thermoanaerobaculia bacterium]|nr:DUF1573 domain-containing protein [Thermoanaerobaculia bacterium]